MHASVVGDSHGVVTWPARIAVLLRDTLSNQCAYLCADVFERSSAPSTDKGEQIVIWHRGSRRPRSVFICISCLRVVRERISSLWQAEKRDRDTDQAGRKAHRSISNTRKYRPAYTHAGVADWERGAGKQRKRVRQTAIDESNKGFAMLAKMGYKPGEGIGKKKEGIKVPIKAELLPTYSGLGRMRHEEKQVTLRIQKEQVYIYI